jgi:hypothetical protein
MNTKFLCRLAAVVLLTSSVGLRGAATVVVINGDAAGVGFNDPTPVAPVGGNSGTTLGQQRLLAIQYAAGIWGATLTSSVPITLFATVEALTCTATSAVLASAGAITVFRDFTGAPKPGAWYGTALANKLFGSDLDPAGTDIRVRFNINLGKTGCLTGVPFYLGLDNNHGAAVDLVATLLHELCHGLGFQTFTNGTTGAPLAGFPSAFDHFLFDKTLNKTWHLATNAERVMSAVNTSKLVWNGANVSASVPAVLSLGTPILNITAPSTAIASYTVATAAFGPVLTSPGVSAEVMPVVDTAPNLGLAGVPLSPANAAAVAGKIAVVDRGTFSFVVKVKNCQNAGAVGVIVVNNVAGSPTPMGGADPTITIPSIMISQADGNILKALLAKRSRTRSGVYATIGIDLSLYAGADGANRVLMYTPNPFASGSSISHWDTSPFPNQLMEPAINADLLHSVLPPADLSFNLLRDLGW